ncbi:MAG: DUF424 family protein [Thermofilum sp.]|nr:DUF424 family protein [Thermofilum sp.]
MSAEGDAGARAAKLQVYYKLHVSGGYTMLAICDVNLLGKELHHGKVKFKVAEEFFGGSLIDAENPLLKKYIAEADSITALGELSLKIIEHVFPTARQASITVAGIPYIQVFKSNVSQYV